MMIVTYFDGFYVTNETIQKFMISGFLLAARFFCLWLAIWRTIFVQRSYVVLQNV